MNHSNGHAPTAHDYFARLDSFRRSDAEREALVQDVLQQFQQLQHQYTEKCNDYENEVASRRMWQQNATNAQRSLQLVQNSSDTNPFVLALIDGDGAVFQDVLYKAGADGGADAAHQLAQEISCHVAGLYPDENTVRWNILTYIYYNQDGLASKLRSVGIVKSTNDVAVFARAFGLNQPLFSFIDVGTGKERADHKMKEIFRLFLSNAQCKHILFGGCHDNGYLPVLDPYKRNNATASRISLLETLPAMSGFYQLGMKMVSFPLVFRSQHLPGSQTGAAINTIQNRPLTASSCHGEELQHITGMQPLPPPPTRLIPKSVSPAPSADSGNSSWATVGKDNGAPKTINIACKSKGPTKKYILINVHEERLDADLPRVDNAANARLFERIGNKKVCNMYHLLGKCDKEKFCDYDHGKRLSPGEQLALRHRARQRSCPDQSGCYDPECVNGHVCPYADGCYQGTACWFADTHQMDKKPAYRLYEDGKKEVISVK